MSEAGVAARSIFTVQHSKLSRLAIICGRMLHVWAHICHSSLIVATSGGFLIRLKPYYISLDGLCNLVRIDFCFSSPCVVACL